MAKIGYIMTAPGYTDYQVDAKWMEDFGCVEIVREDLPQNEKSRTLWDALVVRLQPCDTIVVSKLSNALKGARQLVSFLERCRVDHIRLISIHDRIDSHNLLFTDTQTSDILTAIALFPKVVSAMRKSRHHVQCVKKQLVPLTQKAASKSDRNKRIISMYLQGATIDEIYAASGFSSKSSIWRILNNAGISLTRGHTRGPLGPRKKKEEIEV